MGLYNVSRVKKDGSVRDVLALAASGFAAAAAEYADFHSQALDDGDTICVEEIVEPQVFEFAVKKAIQLHPKGERKV